MLTIDHITGNILLLQHIIMYFCAIPHWILCLKQGLLEYVSVRVCSGRWWTIPMKKYSHNGTEYFGTRGPRTQPKGFFHHSVCSRITMSIPAGLVPWMCFTEPSLWGRTQPKKCFLTVVSSNTKENNNISCDCPFVLKRHNGGPGNMYSW